MTEESPTKKIKQNIDLSKDDEDIEDVNKSMEICQPLAEIEIDNDTTKSLKIVDLNDDCLERIFQHFNLIDLTNVAESNVRLAAAAKHIFAQVHQMHRLFLKSRGEHLQIPEWHPLMDRDNSMPLNKTIVTNMFKHFGKFMRRIKVLHALHSFGGMPNFNIVNLIAEHCRNTLIELECFGLTAQNMLGRCDKPFVRLERLIFSEVVAHMTPAKRLAEMYPNLRSLEFHNVFHVFEYFTPDQQLPNLEHFGIFTFPYTKCTPEYIPAIQRVVNMHPRLRSLSIYDLKDHLNLFTLAPMPNIEKLEIGGRFVHPSPPFQFGNLRSLKLIYSNENAVGNLEWRTLPTDLERLEIVGFHIDGVLIDLIKTCPNLKSFIVTIFEPFDIGNVVEIAQSLRLIEEVEFISKFIEDPKSHMAFAGTLKFMEHCPQLRKAIATIQLEKADTRFKINHWTYVKSNDFLLSYKEKVKKTFIFNWWRWSIKHEVKIIEYLKGWQSGPCFCVSFENNHNTV